MHRDINQIGRYKSIFIMECPLHSSCLIRNYLAKAYILLLIPAKPTHSRQYLLVLYLKPLKPVALFQGSLLFPHILKQTKNVRKKISSLVKIFKMCSAKSEGFQLKKLRNTELSFKSSHFPLFKSISFLQTH